MSIRFDNAADLLSRTGTGIMSGTNCSVMFFWKLSVDTNTYACPFHLGNAADSDFLLIETNNDGTTQMAVDDQGGGTVIATMTNMTVGTWYCSGWSKTGTSITFFYGTAGAAGNFTTQTVTTNALTVDKLLIGNDAFSEPLDGCIAGVKIWEAALTTAEMENEKQQLDPLRTANLWAYYPLFSAADCTVDYTGQGRTLTVGNVLTTGDDNPPVPVRMARNRVIRPYTPYIPPTRVKTVEFPFIINSASLATATRYDFTSITVDIPEAYGRTFYSVQVVVTCCDHDAVGGANMTARLIGIKLGGTAFDDESISEAINDSYARRHFQFNRDVTNYFNSNFGTGSSQTCQVGVSFTGTATQSICAKLIVTYGYSEVSGATTRVKTVKIPIESNTGLLTATLTELGTNSVPKLTSSGLLPEASVSIKQMWFEFYATESGGANTDYNLAVSLDAESEVSMGTLEMAKLTSTEYFAIWVRNDMDPTTTHALKARTSTTTRMCNLGAVLCVTYTYNHSTTTSFLNSLELVMPYIANLKNNDGSGMASKSLLKFFVEEPGTITLKQSAVHVRMMHAYGTSVSTLNLRAGAQSFTAFTYTPNTNGTDAGGVSLIRRIDSGSVGGAGITLARGENTFSFDLYNSAATDVPFDSITGLLILNYTSDLHTLGSEAHNHTTKWCIQPFRANTTWSLESPATTVDFPESAYYMMNAGMYLIKCQEDVSPQSLSVQRKSTEGVGQSWIDLFHTTNNTAYCHTTKHYVPIFNVLKRHINDPDTSRIDIETSRVFRMYAGYNSDLTQGHFGLIAYVTYHTLPYIAAGYISGYTGDGSGITVNLHRSDTHELIGTVVSTIGGVFTYPWFDNVISLYAHARQDSTHRGRSDNATAI